MPKEPEGVKEGLPRNEKEAGIESDLRFVIKQVLHDSHGEKMEIRESEAAGFEPRLKQAL